MQIERAEVLLTKIPVIRAHKMAIGTTTHQENVIVKLFADDGTIGLGEAPHMVRFSGAGETQRTVTAVLKEFLLPSVLGQDPLRIEAHQHSMEAALPQNPRAKSAVNMALYDLAGKILETPVYNLLGGKCRDSLPLSWSIPITDFDAGVEEASEMVDRGWKVLKIKVGRPNPNDDVTMVKLIRETVGEVVHLRVDANQAYDVKTAIKVTNAIEDYNIDFMEQPVHKQDLAGLAEVCRSVRMPIMADEAADSPRDVFHIATYRAAEIISVYINNPGGVSQAKKMAAVAEATGLKCYIGGALEGPVGASACLHFGVSTPSVTYGCEMGGQFLLERDVAATPLQFKNGELYVPDGVGLGMDLDQRRLNEYIINSYTVSI
ncbi:MAG: mandelate racemase/muconate lactonizing enzyme family protein [Candidatus Bipolaricaulia bacterium]